MHLRLAGHTRAVQGNCWGRLDPGWSSNDFQTHEYIEIEIHKQIRSDLRSRSVVFAWPFQGCFVRIKFCPHSKMTKSRFSFLRNLCCDKRLQEPTAEEGEYTPNIPKSSAGIPTSNSTRTEVSGEEVTSGVVAAEIFEVPCDSKSLWDEAYNNLKEEEAQLLDG